MRIINTESIRSGMILGKHVYSADGRILLAKGAVLSENYIANLVQKKIPAVYIDDEISEGIEIEEIIDTELKIKAINTVRNIFESMGQNLKGTNKKCFVSEEIFSDVRNIINSIMDNMKKARTGLINMVEIMSTDLATYTHCVNTAVLAILTGRGLGYDEKIVQELGIGALLHDIGMVHVPTEILNKPGKLTPEEFKFIREHPLRGYEMIKEDIMISAYVKTIVLMHHERLDGSGYPMQLKADKINNLVRIITICDIFEALTAERVYRKKFPVYQALEFLESQTKTTLDHKIYKEFIKNIAIYPVGTGVVLNSGEKGLVVENNKEYPTRPRIRIIFQNDGNYYPGFKLVDLMKELTLFVEDTCDIYSN